MRLGPLVPALALMLPGAAPPGRPSAEPPVIQANDNRTPAGRLAGGTLELRLVAQVARRRPAAADRPSTVGAALGADARGPSTPAPPVRNPLGTRTHATARTDLPDSTLVAHGLSPDGDSLVVTPGET